MDSEGQQRTQPEGDATGWSGNRTEPAGRFPHRARPDRDARDVLRRQRAVELRAQGWSYRQIGDELGVGGPRAFRIVDDELRRAREITAAEAERMRAQAHALNEEMVRVLTPIAIPANPNAPPNVRAIERITRILDADARLLGYAARDEETRAARQRELEAALREFCDDVVGALPLDLAHVAHEALDRALRRARDGSSDPESDPAAPEETTEF